jgi:hypothetical protein
VEARDTWRPEKERLVIRVLYNKRLASETLCAVPPGGKNAELGPNRIKKIVWCGLGKGSLMIYYVVRVGRGQRDGILGGECWAWGSVMVYFVVRVGKGQSDDLLCGEG